MDYETDIAIHQYSSDGNFYYNLKVTDVMNMDYLYMGNAPTLEGVMDCIKLHLEGHQN
jgi:hypothetical protein